MGLVLLDEVVLEQQRVRFAVHYRILYVRYPCDEQAGFGVQPFGSHEILRHPLVEVLGLAHINDRSLGIVITVDSGGMGKKLYFFTYFHPSRWARNR